MTAAGFAALAGGDALRITRLIVGGPGFTDDSFAGLADWEALSWLIVASGPATGTGLAALSECESLTILVLSNGRTTDAAGPALAALPNLAQLSLYGGRSAGTWGSGPVGAPADATAPDISDAIWASLAEGERLQSIEVRGLPVAGPGLAALQRSRGAMRGLTDESKRWALLGLSLHETGLTDETLRGLPALPIRSLSLYGDPITADAVVSFAERQPTLNWVTVQSCPAAGGDGPARIDAALAGR